MDACIDANEGVGGSAFKTGRVFYVNGWKDDDCTMFVAGNRLFTDNYGKLKEEECIFGDESRAKLFNEKGTQNNWVKYIPPILKYPNPRFVFYAAFTAPLLKWLAVDSFAIDIYGGKTGIRVDNGKGIRLDHNTFYGLHGSGWCCTEMEDTVQVVIDHNIFHDYHGSSGSAAVQPVHASGSVSVNDNVLWNVGGISMGSGSGNVINPSDHNVANWVAQGYGTTI
jgi:hypothetical protein